MSGRVALLLTSCVILFCLSVRVRPGAPIGKDSILTVAPFCCQSHALDVMSPRTAATITTTTCPHSNDIVHTLVIPRERWQRRPFPSWMLLVVAGTLMAIAAGNLLLIASNTLPLYHHACIHDLAYQRIPNLVSRAMWLFVAIVCGHGAIQLAKNPHSPTRLK